MADTTVDIATKTCKMCNETKSIDMFSKHNGTKDKLDQRCKKCVTEYRQKNRTENKKSIEYTVYEIDLDYDDWQLGKPAGTILKRTDAKSGAERYEVRHTINGKLKSKSFALNNYDSPEEAFEKANEYLYEFSTQNDLTRNMIRVVEIDGEKCIEVQLTQDMIMITDLKFGDVVQKYTLVSTKAGREGSQYYASVQVNSNMVSFHNYITGYTMTDHINRNPMDNRLCNLRQTTHKENNNNRSGPLDFEGTDKYVGVRKTTDEKYWQAMIKQDGEWYSTSFSIAKYGEDIAKQLAIDHRKTLNKLFNSSNAYKHEL